MRLDLLPLDQWIVESDHRRGPHQHAVRATVPLVENDHENRLRPGAGRDCRIRAGFRRTRLLHDFRRFCAESLTVFGNDISILLRCISDVNTSGFISSEALATFSPFTMSFSAGTASDLVIAGHGRLTRQVHQDQDRKKDINLLTFLE